VLTASAAPPDVLFCCFSMEDLAHYQALLA